MDIQGWSEVPRGKSSFHTTLSYQTYPVQWANYKRESALSRPRQTLHLEKIPNLESSNYSLAVASWPDVSLPVRITYRADMYEEETIRRMLGHLQRVLEQVAEDAGKKIGELEICWEKKSGASWRSGTGRSESMRKRRWWSCSKSR